MLAVEVVERPQRAVARLPELQNHHPPARAHDAGHLGDSNRRIGNIANAEGDIGHVEAVAGEGERHDVGDFEADRRSLRAGQLDHLRREIDAHDIGASVAKSDRHVAGAGGAVEDALPPPHARPPHRPPPPREVHARGEDRVGAVIARGDRREHRADARRIVATCSTISHSSRPA